MLILQNIAYNHPDKTPLLDDISLTIGGHEKVALVGNNGTGKSTLLKLIAGQLHPVHGTIKTEEPPYYIPQHFGQYNNYTVAQALFINDKINALHNILAGDVTEENFFELNDDWAIEERCAEAMAKWGLAGLDLNQVLGTLSGGQKTKLFLAGIDIHKPRLVLMDEPTNHLDAASREMLYSYVRQASEAMLIVSHDRALLNLLPAVLELNAKGITRYGGNYDFYQAQKEQEIAALMDAVTDKEKELRKARETARESIERQQKLDARGRKKQVKAGVPTIALNTLRNNAEKSTARTQAVHADKTNGLSEQLLQAREALPDKDKMKLGFDGSGMHKGKLLLSIQNVNYSYGSQTLWREPMSFDIVSGRRIAITGSNGSGKTTLIKLLLGNLQPSMGNIAGAGVKSVYIDQDYSIINDKQTVYEQAQKFNIDNLPEHELKSRLTHFLFTKSAWDKHCSALSGGEKMRLILCCITIGKQPPDIIILDEPTNNLDLQNIEILTGAIASYEGTLIVVSHDAWFLGQIGVDEYITL